MDRTMKYKGIFPAFYACYDEMGQVSPERVRMLTRFLLDKGVQGLYVGGSSGECIYQTMKDRKTTLENVMAEAKGQAAVIAHVACNNTAESMELAAHAESLGVDAIASIPPIYFHLPEHAIAAYWNDISAAAPHTDFVIYNIPQLAGVSLTQTLLTEMLKNPRVIGVKNSSMPVQDIQTFRQLGGKDFIVFNGPDEQFLSGLAAGAVAGIGGTYAVMPELYERVYALYREGQMEQARILQNELCCIIGRACETRGNMYATLKAVLRRQGVDVGGVRKPLAALTAEDMPIVEDVFCRIERAKEAAL